MQDSQAVCRSRLVSPQLRSVVTCEPQARMHCACCNPYAPEDEVLVERCLAGDQQAWAELVKSYRSLVFSIAARFGATREDAADIFQSVCIEVYGSLHQLKSAQSLRSWLITVTVRQAFRWRRKQSKNDVPLDAMEPEAAAEVAVAPHVSNPVLHNERERIVREGVAQLPARSAEMLRLLFYEHPPLPYEEVARRLGLARGSIGFLRGRALTKLRKILAESGCDERSLAM